MGSLGSILYRDGGFVFKVLIVMGFDGFWGLLHGDEGFALERFVNVGLDGFL